MRAEGKSRKPGEARIRARNKARILKAAVQLFAAKGLDGTRLGEIADLCDLPRANLYYYFETKEGIYAELIEQVIAGWDRAFEHIRADRDPREAIKAYVLAKLEYSRTHSVESRFFTNEMLRGAEFLTQSHRTHMREVTRQRADVLHKWIEQGKMAPVDPLHFFILLWSATQFYADHGNLVSDILEQKELAEADFEAAASTICTIILDGCGAAATDPATGQYQSPE